jgi:hypothetical protein
MLKRITSTEDGRNIERFEFLILVTIEKERFASQFNTIFEKTTADPPTSRDQIAAVNRVKGRFFEGF